MMVLADKIVTVDDEKEVMAEEEMEEVMAEDVIIMAEAVMAAEEATMMVVHINRTGTVQTLDKQTFTYTSQLSAE